MQEQDRHDGGDDQALEDDWRLLRSDDGTLIASYLGWVRECRSPVDPGDCKALAVEGVPPEELGGLEMEYCGEVDMTRVYRDHELDEDPGWRCSLCGGRRFEYSAVYRVGKVGRPVSADTEEDSDGA